MRYFLPRRPDILLLLTAFFLSFTSPAISQTDADAPAKLEKSPLVAQYDKKALEKLKKMSPEEVKALDEKLAQALTLFYDRDYARALPIFREIADKVETMDVAFWYGTCAARAGEAELAIQKFQEMLAVDPNLHRVRLELATVYMQIGRYDDARRELNTVLEAKPPETVKQNIRKLMASIDAKTKKIFPNIRASMGLFYDTNVSAGPDESNIQVPGGGLLNLTQEQGELDSLVWMFNMAGNVVYDFGDKNGWMWNTTGSFFNTHVFEYPQYDFLQWRLTSGAWWVGRNSVLKMPLGYAQTTFEHDHLYDTWDLSPSYEYFFTNWFSVRGLLAYARDTYEPSAPPDDRSGQNNLNRIWEINPNVYLNNRQDILSFFYTGENLNAKEPRFSYDATNLALSYYKRFQIIGWDMELYTRFKYTKRDYDAAALLWPADQPREDDRYNFYIVLSRNFCKHFFASASYNWIRNESNTDLYDFTKQVWGLNAGVRF